MQWMLNFIEVNFMLVDYMLIAFISSFDFHQANRQKLFHKKREKKKKH